MPGVEEVDSVYRSGPWTHRGRDLDSEAEIVEMVTRQYVDVGQDDLLQPYFDFGATGMAWAMAQRFLGHGVWRPADRR